MASAPGGKPAFAICEALEPRIVLAGAGQFFDADGDFVSLKLKGAGTLDFALLQPDDKGRGALDTLTLTGTDAKSVLAITVQKAAGGDGLLNIGQISVEGPLKKLSAASSSLVGTGLNATGALGAIVLRDLANGAGIIAAGAANFSTALVLGDVGADSDITVAGKLSASVKSAPGGQWTAANFAANLTATAASLGTTPALASLSVSGGDFTGNISAQGAVGDIAVKGNASGQWTAQRFGNITVTKGYLSAVITASGPVAGLSVIGGDLTGDLFALGKVGNVSITKSRGTGGSIVDSTLTAAGFGNVTIGKNLTDSLFLAGASLGADNTLGGTGANADTFAPGKVGVVTIGESVSDSTIGGGLDPTETGDDALLGNARTSFIKSFTVGESLSADSLVGAYLLPPVVKFGGNKIHPVADPRFLTHGSLGANFLTFRLANDTGLYDFDAVSQDVAVTAHLAMTSGIGGLRSALDDRPLQKLNVTPTANGDFTLPVSALETLNGGPLANGEHTLRIVLRTTDGGTREASFTFELDRQVSVDTSIRLSPGSDTGTPGDGSTSAMVVNLVGTAEPNSKITLIATDQSTLADNTGKFLLPNIALVDGANPLAFGITDRAGNTATLNATFTKAGLPDADVVLEWNAKNLEAIRLDTSAPPVASRGLAMTSIAMFDVVSAFDGTSGYYTNEAPLVGASLEAAIAAAAHGVLSYLYPGQKTGPTGLDAALADTLLRVPDGAAETDGVAFGESIATMIIAIRSGDGFDNFVDYTPGNLPGDWQLTSPMYDVALLPQWATLQPFALQSPDQFRPDGPPALDSAEYAAALNEVRDLGSATSTTRTADEKEIARFWADGVGTVTPAGHWNQIANAAAIDAGNSTAANARLLATLNVALADAAISARDAKYFYESWRPITAIHDAENDGNAATVEDDAWQPLLLTPPFPEYISGHSTFSGAAADVLTSFFGADYDFTIGSPGLPSVTRDFASFDAAAQEAGQSRIFGGIHFQFANQDGLVTGKKVGDFVLARFNSGADTSGPLIMADGLEEGDVFAASPTISGHILDNLSGVASATAKFDNAEPIALTFDTTGTGKFTIPAQTLAHGAHTLVINATDAVGNAASPFTVHFTVDDRDPTLTLNVADVAPTSIDSTTRLTGIVDGTGSPIVSLCYQFDESQIMPILYNTATGAFDIQPDLSALAPGAHTLTIDALDAAGNLTTQTVDVTLDARIPFAVTEHTPASFASEVGSTFRPQVFFSRPVDPASLKGPDPDDPTVPGDANFYATDTTGAVIPATIVPAQDGGFAWLFFQSPMPGASTVTVHLLGDTILAAADQQPLDGDENGTPGGALTYSFSTVSLTPLDGTSLRGRVVDPGEDLKPMTFDDFKAGPDGIPHTADDKFEKPIAGVRVFIVGLESVFDVTDAEGNFFLPSVPGGNVKLAIDGNTATNEPAGFYFPEMVMDLQIVAGRENTVMDSMGEPADKIANAGRPKVYLPRLQESIKKEVPADGIVRVDAKSAPNLTPEQLKLLTLEVQPGSVLDENGDVMTNPKIGISTVPPELVRDMLPPGVLQHTFDITIQAPDAATFGKPLQLTFPNVFNGKPGEKLNFLSFDHTTGRLVIEGTATVSVDGLSVVTDPGTGITKPGWHGLTPPGSNQGGSGCDSQIMCCFAPPPPPGPDGDSGSAPGSSNPAASADAKVAALVLPIFCAIPCDPQFIKDEISAANSRYNKVVTDADINYRKRLRECLDEVNSSASLLGPIKLADCNKKAGTAQCKLIEPAAKALVKRLNELKNNTCDVPVNVPTYDDCGELTYSQPQGVRMERLAAEVSAENLGPNVLHDNLIRFDSIIGSFAEGQLTLAEYNTALDTLLAEMDAEVGGNAEAYLVDHARRSEMTAAEIYKEHGVFPGNAPDYSVPFVPHLFASDGSEFEIRGKTAPGGAYSIFVPAGARVEYVAAYNAHTNSVAVAFRNFDVNSANRLEPFDFVSLSDQSSPDADSDKLPDIVEDVLGTSIDNADTDKDGIPDGAEVFRGDDPLSSIGIPTKIVAATSLAGPAKGVVVGQASTATATNLAFVATGSAGLAVLDVTNPLKPAIMSQIKLQGDAGVAGDSSDVAFSTSTRIAVVASGPAGLKFVDVSDLGAPKVTGSKPINATQVEIHGGIAYANDGNVIRAYSIETGDLFQTISVGSTAVTGLAIEGDHLYAMDAGKNLTAFDLSGSVVTKQDSESTAPVGGGQLTVGSRLKPDGTIQTVAYLATETPSNNATGGFATWNVSDPNDLEIISGVDANNLAGRSIALNGSGLAVNVGSPGSLGNHAHLIRVSDPTNTGVLLTPDFVLPADPQSVVISNGLAFIADDTAGLLVVNYISPDVAGVPPTASLSWVPPTPAGAKPTMTTAPVQAGSLIPIKLTVADDAQVASVELLKDGVVIGTDTSFPFEFGAIPAGLTAGGQTTLQIRATDTGGNAGFSNTLIFDLIADTTAPTLTGSNPAEGGTRSGGLQTVRLFFSEALTQTDLTADHFTLTGPGGATVPVKTVTFSQLGKQVSITFDPLAAGAYTLRLDAANLHDLSGNALGTTPLDRHSNVVEATKTFINPDGGDWNSPANWENGTLPTASDIVALPLNPGKSVTISSGAIKVQSILTDDTLQVTGGSLTLTGASDIAGILKVSNGADLIVDGLNASLTVQNPLLDGSDLISRNGRDFHFPTLQVFERGTLTVESAGGDFDAPVLQSLNSSSVYVRGGGTVSIPALTSYTHSVVSNDWMVHLQASGPGSSLSLPNLASITNGVSYNQRIFVEAFNGATVDLHSVVSILDTTSGDQRYRQIDVKADGTNSLIDLVALLSFKDNYAGSTTGENLSSAIREFNQGTILVPAALVTVGVIVSV